MKNHSWTREETIVVFNIYCKIPFKKSSKNHPLIIQYANIIGRSPSALNMKIGNFGRLDPELRKKGIVGLSNGSKLEETIWNEFHENWNALTFESEKIIINLQQEKNQSKNEINLNDLPEGKDCERLIKTRENQNFFRSTVLASYNNQCCITGLQFPELLIASHIIPWSKNSKERLNPTNGLCLNALHDAAFDKGYLTITTEYKIELSSSILDRKQEHAINESFMKYNNQSIILPDRFLPEKDFLDYHYRNVFKK